MSLLLRLYPGDAWGFLAANVLVQVTAVIVMAWLLAHLGSRWNAAWRHGIYLVALICVLASPLLPWVMLGTGIALVKLRPPVPTAEPIAAPAAPAPLPAGQIAKLDPRETPAVPQVAARPVPLEAESFGQNLQSKTTPARSLSNILRALAAGTLVIWLLGMALFLARWCYGLHLIAVLRRTAQPLSGEGIVEVLDRVRRALGTDELPPLATSVALDRPAMVGLIRPLVILPEDLLGTLRGPELADILVHECAHAVCRHQVVGLLQRLAGILFWPHPLMHLLNRELARAREEVCDNYVLRQGNAPRYARTLLELSQSFAGMSWNSTALGLFHCRWRLEDRIADLLDQRRKIMIRVNHWTTTALAASFLLLALLIACTRVIYAEPAAGPKAPSPASSSGSPNQPSPATSQESSVPGSFPEENILFHRWQKLDEQQADAITQRHIQALMCAAQIYADQHGSLPPAVVPNPALPPERRLSGIVLLLPYLGIKPDYRAKGYDWWWAEVAPSQEDAEFAHKVYKSIDLKKAWDDPANLPAARTVLPILLAPRNGPFHDERGNGLTHFALVRGAGGKDNGAFPEGGGVTYTPSPTCIEKGSVMTPGIGQICSELGPWIAAGTSTARYVYSPADKPKAPTFGSNYGNAAYFAFCDASIHFIDMAIDRKTLYAWADKSLTDPYLRQKSKAFSYGTAAEWKIAKKK